MSSTTIGLVLAMVGLHASFTWARIHVFRIDGRTPLGVRLIEGGAAISVAVGLVLVAARGDVHPGFSLAAALVALASASVFAWALRTIQRRQFTAAFSNDVPTHLVTRGPYRYIRHPFYLSYMLAHAVPLMATASPWSLPGLLGMGAIYLRACQLEERKFLASPLAEAWRAHQRRTGRFLPRWLSPWAKEGVR